MKLTLRRSFLVGLCLGEFLAILVGVILLLPFPFSHDLHVELVTIGFWLCPFYLLIFMNLVHSLGAVVAISLVGNPILFGIVGAVLWLFWRLVRIGPSRQVHVGLRSG